MLLDHQKWPINFLAEVITKEDVAVDATMGNGHECRPF